MSSVVWDRARHEAWRPVLRTLAYVALMAGIARPAESQLMRDSATSWLASAGSEGERYLRTLQVAGIVRPASWSVRAFSGRELRRLAETDSSHPWAAHFGRREPGVRWIRLVQPELTGVFNSRFAFGSNDGPTWAGRGLTTTASVGVEARVGPLEFTLAPQVFRAENWSYPIAPNGLSGPQQYGDAHYGDVIDLPQRFGNRPQQRLDAGQSSVRIHLKRLAIGVSTANEVWGPVSEQPFLLSTNAAGFLHAFVGTDRAVEVGPLELSIRIIAGRLDQSPYAAPSADERRYVSGAIAVVGLRYVPGLEIGGARIFQSAWPDSGLSLGDFLTPLYKNPFKSRLVATVGGDGTEPDNQIASVFARWNVPGAGLELYGEMAREDNAFDVRDFLVEPDRDMAYSLGLQRVWKRSPARLVTLRAEVMNSSASHLAKARQPAPAYVHNPVRQGHTQRGQILGAPAGFGGGAGMVAIEWLTAGGRRTLTWRRALREPTMLPTPVDVVHSVTAEWLLFRPRIDLVPEATLAYNLNRDAGGSPVNLRVALTGRFHW